ncbi:MAG: JAB domain-containing protein [Sphingomonadaceae bacterium]|jgi:DNA repair protein RadC
MDTKAPQGSELARDPWAPELEIRLRGQDQEFVAIAYLDAQAETLGIRICTEGRQGDVVLPLKDILRDVLDKDPHALVLAHNHPSGDPRPSATDRQATQALCAMLRPLGVRLADHIILAGDERISFRDLGLL